MPPDPGIPDHKCHLITSQIKVDQIYMLSGQCLSNQYPVSAPHQGLPDPQCNLIRAQIKVDQIYMPSDQCVVLCYF